MLSFAFPCQFSLWYTCLPLSITFSTGIPAVCYRNSFAIQYILIYNAVCMYVWGGYVCVWVCVCVNILVYTNGIYSVCINESYILGTTVKQKHTSMKLYI